MIDAVKTRDRLVEEIRTWINAKNPNGKAVLGISGGKDSTVVAGLLVRALGADRVIGVMMPNGTQKDINDSYRVFKALGIKEWTVNIGGAFNSIVDEVELNGIKCSDDAKVNLQPKLRLASLYAILQSVPNWGFVINTSNRSETYVGYGTKWGDFGTGDVSVLGNYFVSEIFAIGDTMPELPYDLVHKAPSDGLWGDTDEDRLGFTYDELEAYIMTGTSGDTEKDKKIARMHTNAKHKLTNVPLLGEPTI